MEYVKQSLRWAGFGVGDRVALVLSQGPEMAVAAIAVSAAATCAPLNPGYRAKEYEFYLTDLGVKGVILHSGQESTARWVAERLGIPVVELSPSRETEAGVFTLVGPEHRGGARGLVSSTDVALVMHTSGTTSRPKIVPLTHTNLCVSASNMCETLALDESDRCLNLQPMFHIHGFMVTLASWISGGSIIVAAGADTSGVFALLDEFAPTWYTAVPTLHQAILARASLHSETIRRRTLRLIRSSSSALPPQVAEDLERVFSVPVLESYGMTEAAHQITSNPLPPRSRKLGSVGLPAGPKVAVMSQEGHLLPSGERGEVVIRGRSVFSGYDGPPEANANAFRDGWFRTGDEGFIDADGYIYLVGRLKEMINRGGQKISPREVEDVLMDHPKIVQAVAFPLPHTTLGEDVATAVLLKAGMVVKEEDLREFVAARLADYKVPRKIVFVEEIPRGETGKIQRLRLAERLKLLAPEQSSTERLQPRDPLELELVRIWEEVVGVRPIGIDDNFFDLGGHSLLAAEMMDRVEQAVGYRVPLASLFTAATVRQIATVLRERRPTDQRSPLLQIQSGQKRPFVFLHGDYLGGGFYCLNLARLLGPEQPFFVLPPHGLDGEPAPETIESMARDYVNVLRASLPTGPYVLGGFCNGALVALDMARELQASGERVDVVILINPALFSTRLWHRVLYRLVTALGGLRRLQPEGRVTQFLQWKEWAWRRKVQLLGLLRPGSTQTAPATGRSAVLTGPEARRAHLRKHYRRAEEGYLPRSYSGRVAIIYNRDQVASPAYSAIPWRRVISQSTVHEVPGGRLTMLIQHVPSLAECLKRILDEAEAV